MVRSRNAVFVVASAGLTAAIACWGGPLTPRGSVQQNTELLKKLAQKFQSSKSYAVEGSIEVARRRGEDPKEMLADANVRLTCAPGEKYRLHVKSVGDAPGDDFDLVSNGKKVWTFLPASNEYTEQAAPSAKLGWAAMLPEDGSKPEPRDLLREFSLQLVPTIGEIAKHADASFLNGTVFTLVSKKGEQERQTLLYLTIDTATLAIPKLAWLKAGLVNKQKMLLRADLELSKLAIGEADSGKTGASEHTPREASASDTFTFTPPEGAKRVDVLPVGSLTGAHMSKPKSEPVLVP